MHQVGDRDGLSELEVLVVDNAPSSDATEEAIAGAALDGVATFGNLGRAPRELAISG